MLKSLNAIFIKKDSLHIISFPPISHFIGQKAEILVCRMIMISGTWGKRIDGGCLRVFRNYFVLASRIDSTTQLTLILIEKLSQLVSRQQLTKRGQILEQTRPPFTLRSLSGDTAISFDVAFVTNSNKFASTTSVAFEKHMQIGVDMLSITLVITRNLSSTSQLPTMCISAWKCPFHRQVHACGKFVHPTQIINEGL